MVVSALFQTLPATGNVALVCLLFYLVFGILATNLLAVGCYDGNVLVYDVRAPGGEPMYRSAAATKHLEPVTQVGWGGGGRAVSVVRVRCLCLVHVEQGDARQLAGRA